MMNKKHLLVMNKKLLLVMNKKPGSDSDMKGIVMTGHKRESVCRMKIAWSHPGDLVAIRRHTIVVAKTGLTYNGAWVPKELLTELTQIKIAKTAELSPCVE